MTSSRLALTAAIFALAFLVEGCGSKALRAGDGGTAAGGGAGGTGGMSDASAVGGRSGDGGVSPGTVTLQFVLRASQAFCDEACGPATHIEILTSTGQLVPTTMPFCFTSCAADCMPVSCPVGGTCLPHGVAVTGDEISWDGSSYSMSTCGTGTSCYAPRFVSPGRYVARMCATPGVLTGSDGSVTSCSATGATECVDVPFDFPQQAVVEGVLSGDGDGGQDSSSDRSEAADGESPFATCAAGASCGAGSTCVEGCPASVKPSLGAVGGVCSVSGRSSCGCGVVLDPCTTPGTACLMPACCDYPGVCVTPAERAAICARAEGGHFDCSAADAGT